MTPGIYHLIISLSEEKTISIGKLGTFHLDPGLYIYTGSALGGLESRIARHLRSEKCLHWHIDYLLQHAIVIDVITYPTKERLECQFNQKVLSLPGCKIPIPGFGSSDCNCIAHLAHFYERPYLFPYKTL